MNNIKNKKFASCSREGEGVDIYQKCYSELTEKEMLQIPIPVLSRMRRNMLIKKFNSNMTQNIGKRNTSKEAKKENKKYPYKRKSKNKQ